MQKISYFQIHFKELKIFILFFFISFSFIFFITYKYFNIIIYSITSILIKIKLFDYLILTNISQIFFIKIICSLFFAFMYQIPIYLLSFWYFFIFNFNKKKNLDYLKIYLFFFFCYVLSIIITCNTLIPLIFKILINLLNHDYLMNLYLEPNFYENILFILKIFSYSFILFQYPIIIYLIFSNTNYLNLIVLRKYLYFPVIVLSAIISPPDLVNQFLMSLPFFILLEFIFFINFIYKKYKQNFIRKTFIFLQKKCK